MAFTPRLETFHRRVRRGKDLATEIAKYSGWNDKGFRLFFQKTNHDADCLLPSTRAGIAYYLARSCIKLRFLAQILEYEEIFEALKTRKASLRFIIFTEWPLVLWLIEIFLNALYISVLKLRASMTPEEHARVISDFTSPGTNMTRLLTVEPPDRMLANCSNRAREDLNATMQALGRANRTGQNRPQKAWILTQKRSINMFTEARIC